MSDPGSPEQPDDALDELAVKQVIEGLSPAEQRALDALDDPAATGYVRDLERAAAALSLVGLKSEPLPQGLRARLERQALGFAPAAAVVARSAAGRSAAAAAPPPARSAPPASWGGRMGWIAAAACLLLALFGWLRSPPPPPASSATDIVVAVPPPAPPPSVPPTPEEERAALLADAASLKVALGATKDPASAGVSGDVVWNPALQRGFLHLKGLATNDPRQRQYQIWIFDAERDKRYPVDGGVFDVPAPAAGDVVIPIRAQLPVGKAAAFAVTVERPGGVVVSARDHVVALGAAG